MPLYTYECVKCDIEITDLLDYEDRDKMRCHKCKRRMHRMIVGSNVVIFPSGWYDHIATKPIFCESRTDLLKACEKHDAKSVYIENCGLKHMLKT